MNVWRLQTNTNGGKIAEICLTKHVVAMGWRVDDEASLRQSPSLETYARMAKKMGKRYGDAVLRMAGTQPNDIVWMKYAGQYYFARISEQSRWYYDFSEEAHSTDTTNRLSEVFWHLVDDKSDEASVPGCLSTSFIRGSTYQRINKDGIVEYSQMLYNKVAAESENYRYENPRLYLNEKSFWDLLQPEDAEDLLCMWLYKEKGYVVVPSTNKKATELYECGLIDPNSSNRRHIYIQVKKGCVTIDASGYDKLSGEVYFLSTGGGVINADGKEHRYHVVDSSRIYEFAIDPQNASLVPDGVMRWIKFLGAPRKGIIFDTNRTYSAVNEKDMLEQCRVCAYGAASRYVRSYRKGDYALFYAKGKGVVAIGEVVSDVPKQTENGLYHDVRMIVPQGGNFGKVGEKCLSPGEIKEMLNLEFYWSSTIKRPFLSESQVKKLVEALARKYLCNPPRF